MLRELRDWAEELACRAGFDGLPTCGRVALWGALAAAACVVGGLWWSGALSADATAATPEAARGGVPARAADVARSSEPTRTPDVTVHVVGEVRHPGVFDLPGGSRAGDAVAAAGGLLGAADQSAVNLARVVADGEQIVVPREGQGAAPGAPATPGGGAPGKIDLNTASEAQLDSLPGVGPATATKIVADRAANGPFRDVDDLLRVPGIGPSKFDALKDLVTAG